MVQDEAVIKVEDLVLRRIDSTDVVPDREATTQRVRSLLTGVGVADARTASADDLRSGTDRRSLEFCQDIDGPHV